jgi:polygalacturonase
LPLEARAGAPESCAPPPVSDLVVNVKDKGAVGDGRTDDSAAIQAAIDAVAGTKGTVLVPDGVYLVETVGKTRVKLGSDMTLKLAQGAVLKAIPNDEPNTPFSPSPASPMCGSPAARSKATATSTAASPANGAWASA